MFSKRNKKIGTAFVVVLTIGLIFTYIPFIFTPPQAAQPERLKPQSQQDTIPLATKGNSSSTATSTPTSTPR